MSARGQIRTSADVRDTTASPPKADSDAPITDIAEGPIGDIALPGSKQKEYAISDQPSVST